MNYQFFITEFLIAVFGGLLFGIALGLGKKWFRHR